MSINHVCKCFLDKSLVEADLKIFSKGPIQVHSPLRLIIKSSGYTHIILNVRLKWWEKIYENHGGFKITRSFD